MLNNNPHIYLISDSTGETVSIVARSVYARFENIDFNESRWALIRSNKQIDNIIKIIEDLNWENGYFRKDIGFKIIEK